LCRRVSFEITVGESVECESSPTRLALWVGTTGDFDPFFFRADAGDGELTSISNLDA
jgi:hypothetical protein